MRLTKVIVDSFQTIRSADVEFGRGLNVLYGPNDLGKSTLASAIRAALLVPTGSTEAAPFTPWFADASPRVSLTFVDATGHYWTVRKEFGSASTAELRHSKDGLTFSVDCKGRQVEEKIRALLQWGIPAPGGRGAPRGLPTSFLSNVLLGAQTDVDGILGASLAEDAADSGKLRLTKALATLAQDPIFKKVLDSAQAEVDRVFTPKGQRKRAQGSPFVQAGDLVKQLQKELADLQQQLRESESVETNLVGCRDRYQAAVVSAEELRGKLQEAKQMLERTHFRQAAALRLEDARGALAKIDSHATAIEKMEAELAARERTVLALKEKLTGANAGCEATERALRESEETHRLAAGEEGARRRELKRAQLAELASQLALAIQKSESRKTQIAEVLGAVENARRAQRDLVACEAKHRKANDELLLLRAEVEQAVKDLDLARAVLAYGRWHVASVASEDAVKATAGALTRRREAAEKSERVRQLRADAENTERLLQSRRELLPSDDELKAVRSLRHELDVAEASLGGGFSVVVRPRREITLSAEIDGKTGPTTEIAGERRLEAERTLRLAIGNVVDIDITAGALEKRSAVERLRLRWSAEAMPVLARAGVSSISQLGDANTALARDQAAFVENLTRAQRLHDEAAALEAQAGLLEQQARQRAVTDEEVAARKAAIGEADVSVLREHFNRFGTAWETQAENNADAKSKKLARLKDQRAQVEHAASLEEYRVSEARKAAEQLAGLSASLASRFGGEPSEGLLGQVQRELDSKVEQQKSVAAQLSALKAESNIEVARAANAVEDARRTHDEAKKARKQTESECEVASRDFHSFAGECNSARTQLVAMDRPSAAKLVQQRANEFAALPAGKDTSDADVQRVATQLESANGHVDHAKQELHTCEGALSKVGGAAVREEVTRLEEALELARGREKELEVDADAWRLLRDTLRAAENDEGAHLGRALAQPVTKRFVELTAGQYDGLKLTPELKTEGIEVAGTGVAGNDALTALSVGTRDQLATLIRLTVAEQLKTFIILDDHLVHTDPKRLVWFRELLLRTSLEAQVLILTCRPQDYLHASELAGEAQAMRDVAAATIRALDMERLIKRWPGTIPASRSDSTAPLRATE